MSELVLRPLLEGMGRGGAGVGAGAGRCVCGAWLRPRAPVWEADLSDSMGRNVHDSVPGALPSGAV